MGFLLFPCHERFTQSHFTNHVAQAEAFRFRPARGEFQIVIARNYLAHIFNRHINAAAVIQPNRVGNGLQGEGRRSELQLPVRAEDRELHERLILGS